MAMNHGKSVAIHFVQDRQNPSVCDAVVEVELDNGQLQFFTIQVLQASQRYAPNAVPKEFREELVKGKLVENKVKEELVKDHLVKDHLVEDKILENKIKEELGPQRPPGYRG